MVLSTQTVNVLRYSALGLGVFYGLYHQSKLTSRAKKQAARSEYQRKQQLIEQAKAEWAKKHALRDGSGSIISDPDDSRFDLEVFLQQLAANDKKVKA